MMTRNKSKKIVDDVLTNETKRYDKLYSGTFTIFI
ncbi:hypothetical protein FOLKNPGA_00953 [Legionella sp. PC1000]|nr:hypothetical protein FOLKNPGA_00953 [Legionella sp. PC1000]